MEKKLKPSKYVYTNLVNACVRCGEITRAQYYFDEMLRRNLQVNEVTTILYVSNVS
jgi:pentatricopeptide repeat protein